MKKLRVAYGVLGLVLCSLVSGALTGCKDFGGRRPPPEPPPAPRPASANDPLALGTVGAETLPANVAAQPLRGFGLVIGLDGRGSSDCPTAIRDYLIEILTKEFGPQGTRGQPKLPSPAELIDSLDTAVVEVTGLVPAGARRGARFDLYVTAILGSSTQSLEGGLLLPTALRYFDRAASGAGLVAGAVLAEGAGPIFVNPFAASGGRDDDNELRRGYVLGGGRVLEERRTRLMLLRPNYRLAQAIERRINERFGQRPKTAEALSAGYLELSTPPLYTAELDYFRGLVAQLYVDNRPTVIEARLRELARLAVGQQSDLARIAQTWEAIGRGVIPAIQPFYAHSDPVLRFYAARTGLRLGDLSALPVIGAMAAAPGHTHRLVAIHELGACTSPQTAGYLLPLLADSETEVRVAAYEALLQRGHPAIRSQPLPHLLDRAQINFMLDVIDCPGSPLLYVRRTRLPRIAVFGKTMLINPPVFYTHPDDSVTVHTVADSSDVRLFAKRRGRMSEQVVIPPRVADLVAALGDVPQRDEAGRLRGLGLPYSRVVQILAALCADQTIPAPLVLEPVPLVELFGPQTLPERPESEPGGLQDTVPTERP